MTRYAAGFDLTDPFARQPRAIDVALLDIDTRKVKFEQLVWNGFGDIQEAQLRFAAAACHRFSNAQVWVVDGPVGLAMPEEQRRDAEQQLRAPGRTPWKLPEVGARPFAGYIRGSILFHRSLFQSEQIHFAGMIGNVVPRRIDLLEAYPGAAWPALAGARLPSKSTMSGIEARRQLLNDCGLIFERGQQMSHDRLDAALCAFLGYLWKRNPQDVRFIGQPLSCDNAPTLREGQIVQPANSAPNWPKQDLLRQPRQQISHTTTSQPAIDQPPRAIPLAPLGLPQHDWVYFAGPAGAESGDTVELANDEGVIHRKLFSNRNPPQRIPNVAHLQPGQTLLLCYGQGNAYQAVASCIIDAPDQPVDFHEHHFPAFKVIGDDEELAIRLDNFGYLRDPLINHHTVLCVDAEPLGQQLGVVRPTGNNAIWPWNSVFA